MQDFFSHNGIISQNFDGEYEERKGQTKLAEIIESGFCDNTHLIAEAPCGIGKSFAYLVPAIKFALKNNETIIIATANILLQEQLFEKDIPNIVNLFNTLYPEQPTTYSLIKGMNNYICSLKYDKFLEDEKKIFRNLRVEEIKAIDRIGKWADKTINGDKSELEEELPEHIWDLFSANDEECIQKFCPYCINGCYSKMAKTKAQKSKIIVCNYHILFLDAKLKLINKSGILPSYNYLIMDEAHHIESIAREFLGETVSENSCYKIITGLDAIAKQKKPIKKRLESIEIKCFIGEFADQHDQSNSIKKLPLYDSADKTINIAIKLSKKLKETNIEFFKNIKQYYIDQKKEYIRTKEKNIVDHKPIVKALADAKQVLESWSCFLFADTLLLEAKKKCESGMFRKKSELAEKISNQISKIIEQENEDYVYWIECREKKPIKIISRPVFVKDYLKKTFWDDKNSAILVSGTMATGTANLTEQNAQDAFKFNMDTLGLDSSQTKTFICESPFDYMNNCALVICQTFPKPYKEEKGYRELFLSQMQQAILHCDGGALVLFTSYDHLKFFFDNCDEIKKKFKVYAQYFSNINRKNLVKIFKEDANSVLLGTSSFWEGLDVPGHALRLLIIDKIPFPNKNQDPVLDAMADYNENFFNEEYLPRAILKLKQGYGRLLRNQNDKGMIILADPRGYPGQTSYSTKIFNSFPTMRYANNLDVVNPYFVSIKGI